jgi:hypothetical protein
MTDETATYREGTLATLRAEYVAYNERLSSVWMQKLAIVGAMIAFSLQTVGQPVGVLRVGAWIAVPVVSVLVDMKLFEFALHSRVVSEFLVRTAPPSVMFDDVWERVLWGFAGGERAKRLVALRNFFTVCTSSASTLIVGAMAALMIIETERERSSVIIPAACILGGMYLIGTIFAVRVLLGVSSRKGT